METNRTAGSRRVKMWLRENVAAWQHGSVCASRPLPRFNHLTLQPFNASTRHAFTLIEMILAVGIAAIVLITANAALYTALHLRDATADTVDAASPVDSAVAFLQRDFAGCVPPTNSTGGILTGSFRAGNGITSLGVNGDVAVEMYTTTGKLSADAPWADIQRVTYELKNPSDATAPGKDLYRSIVRNLLSISTPQVEDQFMLSGVSSLDISCYDGQQWNPNWDTTSLSTTDTNLPLAVRVDIKMAGNAANQPVEIVVPLEAVARTNMVLTTTATATGG